MPAGMAHLGCGRMCLACSRHPAPLLSILSLVSSRERWVIISRQIWRSRGALEANAGVITQLQQRKGTRKWVCGYGTLQTSRLLALWPETLIWCIISLLPHYALRVKKEGPSLDPNWGQSPHCLYLVDLLLGTTSFPLSYPKAKQEPSTGSCTRTLGWCRGQSLRQHRPAK